MHTTSSSLKKVLAPLCLLFIVVVLSFTTAQAALPTSSAIASQLEKLNPDDTSPPTQALRDTYQQTQNALRELEQLRARIEELNQQITEQPQRLESLKATVEQPLPPIDISPAADLQTLSQQVTQAKADLVQLEQKKSQLEDAIRNNDQRLIDLRAQLASLKQGKDNQTSLSPDLSEEMREATRNLDEILAEQRAARIQMLELELLVLPGENELNQLRLTQTRRQIDQLSAALEEMQSSLTDARRSALESSLANLGPNPDTLPAPLAEISRKNQQSSDRLRELLSEIDQGNAKQQRLEAQFAQINEHYNLIQQQLDLDIPQLSGELRRFTRQLTRPLDTESTRASINQLRLANLNTDRQILTSKQDKASPPDALASLKPAMQDSYQELLDARIRLLNQLRTSRQQLINVRSQILASQQQINEQLRQARALIDQHLLWQPTVEPISPDWPADLAQGVKHLSEHWHALSTSTPVISSARSLWLPIIVPLLLVAVAIGLRRYFRRNRERWYEQIGRVNQDSFSRTLRLLIAAPIISSPIPVLALLLQRSLNPSYPLYDTLSTLLYVLAALIFIQQCLRGWLSSPYGLLCGHLEMPERLCQTLSRELQLLCLLGLPLLAGLFISDGLEEPELLASGGRLLFLLLVLALIRFWWVMWKTSSEFNRLANELRWWKDARTWIGLMLVFNLAMIILGLTGYLLSALFMMMILGIVILQLALTFMLYRLGLRWLLVEERRLAFEQALEKRAEQLAARENSDEEPPTVEEDYLDLKTISLQTRTLLKVAVIALFALLIWLTLGDLLPTLHILDRVPLWSIYQSTADGDVLRAVTLADVTGGVITLALSLLAAYNLPGLLELLVLRHMRLSTGSSFAITTLLKYSLILIGVMAGISQFGLEWSKLQWLVAALGVGLGFGLQEIVANFVSGLILLFEKPIRIGDTVTIGDVTGNVSRIQIRATTLVDWDQKEVVIPNKTFITERLINWSLTDSTTRIVLQVGVAYGSDTQRVKELLVEVAQGHPQVLDDPEPNAYFRAFGNSTLDFDLRVYVSRMEDRIPVTDGLNHEIDRRFREAGIEIAFPQLDVHLYSNPQEPPPETPSNDR